MKKSIKHQTDQRLSKPDLSEIFAAISGIMDAGIEVHKQKNHPLLGLGMVAASKSYDLRYSIARSRLSLEKAQAPVAQAALAFLKDVLPTLREHPQARLSDTKGKKGGTVSDIIQHVEAMISREESATDPRATSDFSRDGAVIKKPFQAEYLPDYFKKAARKPRKTQEVAPVALEKPSYAGAPKPVSIRKSTEPQAALA